ncbi:ralA-binding protein 1 [Piliocolobus tephrosceles]|uniref:ralA-binding protein 1 n=1 Tax=Piliocolobus tephrosceles TaxID=591936 RepID=UPI000E6B2D42|nr:ralA-binding protein 1 [Piliocolobus tephrosceles]
MTECFLPPTSSPSEHRRVEHGSGLTRTPSSEEISPTKFPGLYRTGEPSPPHDILHEPPDIVSDDEKDHGKKKGKFKKKEKRTEGYAAFQEDSSGDELTLYPSPLETRGEPPTPGMHAGRRVPPFHKPTPLQRQPVFAKPSGLGGVCGLSSPWLRGNCIQVHWSGLAPGIAIDRHLHFTR